MKAYKNRYLTGSLTALLSCLLLFSCSEDKLFDRGCSPAGEYSDHISFGVSPDTGVQTRGAAGMGSGKGEVAGNFVLRAADAPDTLCMQAVITDGINPSSEPQVVTRSTPIDSKDNFYNSFHVVAYWKKGDVPVTEQFYMDADVSEQVNNRWTTDNTYYWPGNGHTLQFYALTPDDAGIRMPATPASTHLSSYTVPQDVAEQHDILVATTEELSGNYNQAVPLTFEHICTAIKFETGSQMQPGSIRSVTLKGVKTTGAYDMFSGKWTLTKDVGNYTQELAKTMTGTETPGSEVTTAAQTFMMLPQTLPQGATVEVVFVDDVTGNERPLSATIDGTEWPQGKTVTYKISISPEYDMSIECDDKVDAHYVIQEIQIKADCEWTLSSDVEWLTFTDWSYDASKPEDRPLGMSGYWIRSERGGQTFSGSGDKVLYAYYDEHTGDQNREAHLTISYGDGSNGGGNTKTITQYCPAWVGNAGYERIEEDAGTYPFGYAWDRKVQFIAEPGFDRNDPSLQDLFGAYVFRNIANDAITEYNADGYVTVNEDRFWLLIWWTYRTTVTIDYSGFNAIGNGNISTDNGLANTRYLYGFENIGQVATIENRLRDNAVGTFTVNVTEDSHSNIPIDQFAVRKVAMKNEFTKVIRESTEQGQTIRYAEAVINTDNIHWYLPASGEQSSLKNGLVEGDDPLDGTYWSSTAVDDNENAYRYDAGGSSSQDARMTQYKIRAARQKP